MRLSTVSLRLAGAALLLASVPAIASASDSKAEANSGSETAAVAPATAATAKPAKAADRKICKVIEQTGSRTAKKQRACMTEREWREAGL